MAQITKNLRTLEGRGLLIGAEITLEGGETVTVQEYDVDRSGKYEILTTDGDVELVDAWIRGTVNVNGLVDVKPNNGKKRKKITKLGN